MSKTFKLIIVLIFTTFYFGLIFCQYTESKIIYVPKKSEPSVKVYRHHWSRKANDVRDVNGDNLPQETESQIGNEMAKQWQAAVDIGPRKKTSQHETYIPSQENPREQDTVQLPMSTVEDLPTIPDSLDEQPMYQPRAHLEIQPIKQKESRKNQARNEKVTKKENRPQKKEKTQKKDKKKKKETSETEDNALVPMQTRNFIPEVIANDNHATPSNSTAVIEPNSLRKGTGKSNCVKKCYDPKCNVNCLGLRSSASCSAQECRSSTRGSDSASLCTGKQCNSMCSREQCIAACDGKRCRVGCNGKLCHAVAHGRSATGKCTQESCFAYSKGTSVIAQCKGRQCESHCFGKKCTAMCSGSNCIAICNGRKCRAKCKGIACIHTEDRRPPPETRYPGVFEINSAAIFSKEFFSHEFSNDKHSFDTDHHTDYYTDYDTDHDKDRDTDHSSSESDYGLGSGYYGNRNGKNINRSEKEFTLRYSMGADISKRLTSYLKEKIGLLKDNALLSLLPNLGLAEA